MRVTFATEPTPGRPNDDYVLVSTDWAIVLDGATALRPDENGCIHDVPWFVRRLAGGLARELTLSDDVPLTDALAAAITSTMAAHSDTCDLTQPDSPSSTVTMARWRGDTLDYLVLADSPLLIERGREVEPVVDDRMAHLDDYSYDAVMKVQNTPQGYYVASTLPDAAYQALHDSVPLADVTAVALLSDGASRLVDLYDQLSWHELITLLRESGPDFLVTYTRQVDETHGATPDSRKRKRYDDASAVIAAPNQDERR